MRPQPLTLPDVLPTGTPPTAELLAALVDGVVLLGPAERVLYVNPAAERVLGRPAGALVGQPLFEVLPSLSRLELSRVCRQARATGVPCAADLYLHLAPARAWFQVQAFPCDGGTGLLFRDVSATLGGGAEERSDHERALGHLRFLADASAALSASLEEERILQRLCELSVLHFVDGAAADVLGPDGALCRVALAHQSGDVVFEPPGSSQPSLEGEGLPEVVRTGQPLLLRTPEALRDAQAFGVPPGVRGLLCFPLTARGEVRGAVTFLLTARPKPFSDGEVELAQELARRASVALENARLYALAEAERRRAQEASRLKDEFLSTVSHELRTPLTSILGWVQMLRAGSLAPEKHPKALQSIERSARAQAQLVEDLLDVSRIITGKLRLDIQTVELASIVDAALEAARPAAQAKGVLLEHNLEPAVVMGDGSRLQQVVWNLLSNAVKFTPPGGTVGVRLWEEEAGARVEVWDSGQGIPQHFLPHVFERFRQAEGSATREHGGLGLGLSIVKHLVELHGGTVSAQSGGSGQGARFCVQLPSSIRAPRRPQGRTLSSDAFPIARAPSVTGLRVLLVEDEPDVRELLATLVEGCQAKVATASNAEEALRLLQEWRPDVLISDVGLPGESGYALLERVRQLPAEQGGRIPAVAVTAYARSEDRTRALLAGFDLHLPKPVEPKELYAVLSALSARVRH